MYFKHCGSKGLLMHQNKTAIYWSWQERFAWCSSPGDKSERSTWELHQFAQEETLLQTMGKRMGFMVDCMLKHCELVGEGIEHAWACTKNAYHQMPLSQKRKKRQVQEHC